MRNAIICGVIACSFVPAFAQNKLTPPTYQRALEAVKLHDNGSDKKLDANGDATSSQQVSVFIELNDGYDAYDLQKIEYLKVENDLGTVFVCTLPADMLFSLDKEDCIKRVSISRELRPQLDYARPAGQVDEAQSGFTYEDATRTFDGTGVVCGMMDTGLEANHINFKNSDGTSRIKRLWHMNSTNGTSVMYTDQTIGSFTTDNTSQGHATHVAGIIGGSYKGNGTYFHVNSASGSNGSLMTNSPIPYYGVATGADLAFAVGSLSQANIINGVTNIIDYAKSVGKPVVVNMSLGSTLGPHDGTDAYSVALTALGKRGIICMSAGNDGDANISIVKKITSTSGNDSMLRTFVRGNSSTGVITGYTDLWGTDNTVLTVEWGIYDTTNGNFTPVVTVNSANGESSTSGNTDFSQSFNGSISASSYIDPSNNRFNVYTTFNGVSSNVSTKAIALRVSGAAVGQSLYLYSSTESLTFSSQPSESGTMVSGFTSGSAANSINDACCADNIISVGSYNTRLTWGRLSGDVYGYSGSGYSVNGISPFSSYGTSFNGTALPYVCAPGAAIISSYSSYYAGGSASTTMSASATSGSNTYYWGQMQGTSMSCPFVSGTIGLWLQADPTLDFDKVMNVIKNTSYFQQLTMRNGRWGYGQIRAVNGLKEVLANRTSAVGEVWADDEQRLIVTDLGGQLEVFVAGGEQMDVTLYDIQGRPVASAKADNGEAVINASQLQKGLYILRVAGKDFSLSRKIMR